MRRPPLDGVSFMAALVLLLFVWLVLDSIGASRSTEDDGEDPIPESGFGSQPQRTRRSKPTPAMRALARELALDASNVKVIRKSPIGRTRP